MKCKYCNGTGTTNWCVNGTFKPCTFCDGTGEYEPFDADIELDKLDSEPQTNEEWLQTATTEQLAEFLTKIILDDKRFRMTMVGGVNETKMWLKQPHKSVTNCNE